VDLEKTTNSYGSGMSPFAMFRNPLRECHVEITAADRSGAKDTFTTTGPIDDARGARPRREGRLTLPF
jgi:hypothetical protein